MKVLVSNATRNSGLAVIRGLAGPGIEIVGTDDRRLPLGLHSRHAGANYVHPEREAEDFGDRFIEILEKEKPDVLIPLAVTKQVLDRIEEIEKWTRVLLPDRESYRIAHDKLLTLERCGKLGIPVPGIFSEQEALERLGHRGSGGTDDTLVVKPRADHGCARGLSYVRDVDSFHEAKRRCESLYGPMVIEEYIPGGTDAMRTLNVIFDRNSRLAAYFTTRKIRQWPTTGGISAVSVGTDDRDLVERMLPFFESLKWRGLAEVEIKMDARDGLPKVIEINPRIWGYIGFPIRCGVNFPMILCRLTMGDLAKEGHYPKYPTGVKYVNPGAAMKSIGHDIFHSREKFGSIRRAVSDLKGRKVGNNFQLSDPLPIFGKLIYQLFERRDYRPDPL